MSLPSWLRVGLIILPAMIGFNLLGAFSYVSFRGYAESTAALPRIQAETSSLEHAASSLAALRQASEAYAATNGAEELALYNRRLKVALSSLDDLHHQQRILVQGPTRSEFALGLLEKENSARAAELVADMRAEIRPELEALLLRRSLAFKFFVASVLIGNFSAFVLVWRAGRALLRYMHLGELSGMALKRMRLYVDGGAEALLGFDMNGACIFVNRACLKLLGYDHDEDLLGKHLRVVLPPEEGADAEGENPVLHAFAQGRGMHVEEGQCWRADGSRISVEYWSSLIHEDGHLSGGMLTLLDISKSKAQKEALEKMNMTLQVQVQDLARHSREMTLFSELTEMLQASLSPDEIARVISAFALELYPDEAGALYLNDRTGKVLENVAQWGMGQGPNESFSQDDCWSLRRGKAHFSITGQDGLFCKHVGEPAPTWSFCLPLIAQGGTLGMLHLRGLGPDTMSGERQLLAVALAQQIALGLSNLKLREALRQDAIKDPLTGLFNRRYMQEALDHELNRARRSGSSLGLMALDLDHFKGVNDQLGHAAGDALLSALGSLIKDSVRSGDIACRLGGDEFLVILPEISAEGAVQLGERIRLGQHAWSRSKQPVLQRPATLSIGVAMFPSDGDSIESLSAAADKALYRAKERGRNCVAAYSASNGAEAESPGEATPSSK